MNPITRLYRAHAYKLQDLCTPARPAPAACTCVGGKIDRLYCYSVLVMMSLQRKTVEAFQRLEVEQLPAEWIADNWEQNFCESIVLPTQV